MRSWKHLPICTKTALVLLGIITFYSIPRSSDTVLLRIPKQQDIRIPEQWIAAVEILQELDTCAIAETSSDMLPQLSDLGLQFEILDVGSLGKPYYLVQIPFPEEARTLESLGNMKPLEDRTYLFWSDTEDIREVLPPHLQLKRLPSETRLDLEVLTAAPAQSLAEQSEPTQLAPLDPRISQMVSQVSKENLTLHIQSLQDFGTRYASTANCESSGDYIYSFFAGIGLESAYDPFSFGSKYSSRNIVATLPGKVAPERVVVVGAHYDSASNQPTQRAPGADDNASGTAAVMEIARIMREYTFDFTVKLVCFSAEEWGLWGSKHCAQEARQNNEKIVAAINMDMIGYASSPPEDLDVVGNPRSEWLADRFISSATSYVSLDFIKRINASFTQSDHSSFWDQGYSAVCGIEDVPVVNPYYHKPTDTIDTLDMDFVTSATRASLATIASLAQPDSIPAPPTGITGQSQVSRSLFSRFKTSYVAWSPSRHQVASYRIYRSNTAHGAYQLISSLPASKTSHADPFLNPDANYFYMITAVDDQGKESNYSREVRDDENNKAK